MKIKIVYEGGGPAFLAKVIDATTGELVQGVIGVRWEVLPGRLHEAPQCVVTLDGRYVAIEAQADAEVEVRP